MNLNEAIEQRYNNSQIEHILTSIENEYPECIDWYLSKGDDIKFDLIINANNCDIDIKMTHECLVEFRLKYL